MLDRALAKMFADLSTLILVACVVTVPIHIAHAFVFRAELSVREMGPEMAALDEADRIRGVNRGEIEVERSWLAIVIVLELLTIPIVARAAKRVYYVSEEGGVPTVMDAYSNLRSSTGMGRPPIGPVAIIMVLRGLTAWLLLTIGTRIADMAAADVAWVGIGSARALAMAVGLAMIAGSMAAMPGHVRPPVAPPEKLELY